MKCLLLYQAVFFKKLKFVSLSGKQQNLETSDETSIPDLKEDVARLHGRDVSEIKLSVKGKPLTNGNVRTNGLKNGHTIDVSIEETPEVGISVRLPNGSCEEMKVKPGEKIADLKHQIQERFDLKEDDFKMSCEGKTIKGGRLPHHEISDGSTISLELINAPTQFTVTDVGGHLINVEAEPNSTIDWPKQLLCAETGVMAAQHTLVHPGRQLNTGTLLSNGIKSGSDVRMVGRQRKG